MALTTREMIRKYLKDNDYDGLFSNEGECACVPDDLCPCGEPPLDCEAGYRQTCDCGDHDFHIGEERENTVSKED